ncbi:CURVATURE THYLAKOID 1A-like protein [Wolffia australiana]
MAAAAMATAAAGLAAAVPVCGGRALPLVVLPRLSAPRRRAVSCSLASDARRFSRLVVKASSSEESSGAVQADDLLADLKEKWDAIDNKSTVLLYGGGALVAVWLSSIVIGAINSVPLLPKFMELVGLGYTGWFVYRYLLFKSSRKELATDIEELKKKIAGTD